jgi:hypothetical protein
MSLSTIRPATVAQGKERRAARIHWREVINCLIYVDIFVSFRFSRPPRPACGGPGLHLAGNLQQNWEKEIREKMVRPLPSKTERLVRAFLLLITSAVLTLVAWSLGLYRSGDSTQVAIAIFAIVIAAVLVSRFSAKRVMRLFGWGS